VDIQGSGEEMKSTARTVVVCLAVLMVFVSFGSMLYRIGENLADLRHDVAALRAYIESQPVSTSDWHEDDYQSFETQLIRDLFGNATSANISLSYDSNGQKGSINIHFEKSVRLDGAEK